MNERRLFHLAGEEASAFLESDSPELVPASLAAEGFVHLSFAEQLAGTLDVHFDGIHALILIEVDPKSVAADLRLEPSRGGALFPHLYRALRLPDVVQVWRIERRGGSWALPMGELGLESEVGPDEEGSAGSGEARYSEWSDSLRVFARTLVGEPALSEDLVQDAWVAALDTPTPRVRNRRAWLAGVVRHLALTHRRSSLRRRELEHTMAARDARVEDDDPVQSESLRELLWGATQEVDEPYREVLVQRFFDEREISDIASSLGRTQTTIRTQVSRGIKRLRSVLDRRHFRRESWATLLVPLARQPLDPRRTALRTRSTRPDRAASSPADAAPSTEAHAGLTWALAGLVLVSLAFVLWRATGSEREVLAAAPARAGDSTTAIELPSAPERLQLANATAPRGESNTETAPPAVPRVRQLDVTVLHRDGRPAPRAQLYYDAPGQVPVWHETEGHELRLQIPEDHLIDQIGQRGLNVTVRTPEEAWSLHTWVSLPAEGARVTIRTRGPLGRLAGVVVGDDGEPVAGAQVSTVNEFTSAGHSSAEGSRGFDLGGYVVTDVNGRFEFHGLPISLYELLTEAEGWMSDRSAAAVRDPHAPESAHDAGVRIVLSRGATLVGSVYNADGTPAAGARVWEVDLLKGDTHGVVMETRADEEGLFELLGLGPGECLLFAHADSSPLQFARTKVDASGEEVVYWDAVLAEHPGIEIELVDHLGQPAAGTRLLATQISGTTVWSDTVLSDAVGLAHFQHVPDGPVLVQAGEPDVGTLRPVLEDAVESDSRYRVELPVPGPPSRLRMELFDHTGVAVAESRVMVYAGHGAIVHAAVDPTTGIVDTARVPARETVVAALFPSRGLVPLGQHEFTAGSELDLGRIVAPAPLSVPLLWGSRAPTSTSPVLVESCIDAPNGAPTCWVVAVLEEAVDALELLPGDYRFSSTRGETFATFKVHAERVPDPLRLP